MFENLDWVIVILVASLYIDIAIRCISFANPILQYMDVVVRLGLYRIISITIYCNWVFIRWQ